MPRRLVATSLLLSLLAVGGPAWPRTIEGVHLEETTRVRGQKAILNGATLLEATVLSLDVYVVGLYLRAPEKRPDRITRCDDLWHVRMQFLRDISRDQYRDGWSDAIEDRPERRLSGVPELVRELLAKLPEVRKGDVQELTYDPKGGLSFTVNGKVVFQAEDRTFCRMVVRGFVDPAHAPGGMAPHLLGHR